ncbi:MAG: photosynthetic complex putative assembly protein PuhB [Pseudomonadota bacterium]
MSHDDFAFEPVKGLPEELPAGEEILWQGAPDWVSLAKRAFFVRAVGVYFGILATWRIFEAVNGGSGIASGLLDAAALLPVAASALIVLGLLAYAYAQSTVYTLTNRRAVMRYGVALPMTINLPLNQIDSAAVRVHRDGTGDIPMVLADTNNIAFLALWPNARPWHMSKAQPMFRAIKQPAAVAKVLTDALSTEAQSFSAQRYTSQTTHTDTSESEQTDYHAIPNIVPAE